MRLFWEGFHREGKVPVNISCYWDETRKVYLIEVRRGEDLEEEEFLPKVEPEGDSMNIVDLEFSVKTSNNLLKKMKRRG